LTIPISVEPSGKGAMSCGFTGLVALQGFLKGAGWKGTVLANEHPTYYGMKLGCKKCKKLRHETNMSRLMIYLIYLLNIFKYGY